MGECSFWYRPTRVVPDQRPLNGRCRCKRSLVKTGKFSDGDKWVKETAGANEVLEEVVTRSRMWFLSLVGKYMC